MLFAAVGAEGRSELRRPADALALGTHEAQYSFTGQPDRPAVPPAVGTGEAGMIYERSRRLRIAGTSAHADEMTYLSIGEGATTKGHPGVARHYVHAQRAGALPVEDNGYAISVPVEVQTPGGDISVSSRLSRT